MLVKHGTFNSGTGTGNISVSGIGFEPDALLMFGQRAFDESANTGMIQSIGIASDDLAQSSHSVISRNSQATSAAFSYRSNEDIHITQNFSDGSVRNRFRLVSMDSDGFTINRLAHPDSNQVVPYVAFGSTNAQVVNWGGSENATQDVTGAGFTPNLAISVSTSPTIGNTTADGCRYTVGVANSSAQWVTGGTCQNAAATTITQNFIRNDAHLVQVNLANDNYSRIGVFDSFIPDGMRINWTVTGTRRLWSTLFFEDADSAIGVQSAPATNGNQDLYIGTSRGLLMAGTSNPAITTVEDDWRLSIGAADRTAQFSEFTVDEDAVSTTNANRKQTTGSVFNTFDATSLAAKESATASVSTSGASLSWSVDGTQGQYGYLVFIGEPLPPLPTGPGNIARRRRVAGTRR